MRTGRTLAAHRPRRVWIGTGCSNYWQTVSSVSASRPHRLPRRRPHGARHRGRVRLCRPRGRGRRLQAARCGGLRSVWPARRATRSAQRCRAGAVRAVRRGAVETIAARVVGGAGSSGAGTRCRRRRSSSRASRRCSRSSARRWRAPPRLTAPQADPRLDHVDDPGRRPRRRRRAAASASSTRIGSIRPTWCRWSSSRPARPTDPAVTARLTALLEAIGKVPVVCAPRPGYIVPRIQALAMNEAARMVEEGVATRRGDRQGDPLRLRLPLCGARHAGIHRLGRRRHPRLREPLSHLGARRRALRRAGDRRAQHARGPHRTEDRCRASSTMPDATSTRIGRIG